MTLTMTALSHPSSSNLTVPTSQNTAPVLSFTCLYTHDLRRKQKRWQDGILRFHTFNKRIMVYDVPRNYIGDTHWRESQAIQDGDELELEKGVLIQVGEEVERTETDVSALLEKRTPKPPAGDDQQTGIPTLQAAAKSQAISSPQKSVERQVETPFAHLRPKSLNALLGRPRGPVGKAVVPTRSPAELRREKENGFATEGRSPKRRRVEYPTSSSPSVPVVTATVDRVYQPQGKATISASAAKGPKTADRRRLDIRVEDPPDPENLAFLKKTVGSIRRLPKETFSGNQGRHGIPSRETEQSNAPDLARASLQANKAPRGRQTDGETVQSKHERNSKSTKGRELTAKHALRDVPPGRAPAEETEPQDVPVDDEPRPEHMLRIASKKPRKKLMYRDLLPQKAPPIPTSRSPNEKDQRHRRSRMVNPHGKVNTRLEDPLDDYHQGQQNRLQSRLSKRAAAPSENTPEHQVAQNEDDDNPVTTDKPASPVPNFESTFPDSLFLTPPSPSGLAAKPTPLCPDKPPVESIPTSTQAARALTELDALLLQRPLKPTEPRPQTRPQIIKAALPPPQKPARPIQRSASDLATRSSLRPTTNNQLTRRSTNALQKSLSDSDTIHSNPPPQPVQTRTSTLYRSVLVSSDTITSAVAQEQTADPWSREAWDLFGYDGSSKRILSGNGIVGLEKKKKGREDDRESGMEDVMAESQGFV
ncbi:MAG: hypothetical protein LQ338_007583 [Usnochroma carphineum]|nr:MAG: hypothetical protein LQ338_007583 [Usnochroma carphineum]